MINAQKINGSNKESVSFATENQASAHVDDIASVGNKVIEEVVSWLLAYHPQPETRAICNRMRYFAVLAYEVINEVQHAMQKCSISDINSARAKFFNKVKQVTD